MEEISNHFLKKYSIYVIIVLAIAAIKIRHLYAGYDIDIFQYIEILEIINLALGEILYFAFIVVVVIIGSFFYNQVLLILFEKYFSKYMKKELIQNKTDAKTAAKELIYQKDRRNLLLPLVFIVFLLLFKTDSYTFRSSLVFLFFLFFSLFLLFIFDRNKWIYKLKKTKKGMLNFIIFIAILIYSGILSQNYVSETFLIDNNLKKVSYDLTKNQISTVSPVSYIGQTRNFIFIKNDSLNYTQILEKDKIENLKFYNNSIPDPVDDLRPSIKDIKHYLFKKFLDQ